MPASRETELYKASAGAAAAEIRRKKLLRGNLASLNIPTYFDFYYPLLSFILALAHTLKLSLTHFAYCSLPEKKKQHNTQ
jgi:hypothetical protein